MTEAVKVKPQLVQTGWGFSRFWGQDEKGNPAAIFPHLLACRYEFFKFIECVG